MTSELANRTDPVTYLRTALASDQFTLFCQPIAALTGSVAFPMAEVLVRLSEEEAALLPPGDFLPVLEHYGMMPAFDRWVVQQVLRKLAGRSQISCFSINLSHQTLADPTFPDFFADETNAAGVPADSLLFEIDEADALALPDCAARLGATIGSLGSGLVIDGFGRAPRCLAALKLPCLQFIKLHDCLTRPLLTGPVATEKLNAVMRIASSVGVRVIAECVDDPALLPRLAQLKIRYAQGFGVCVPISIDEIPHLPAIRLDEGEPSVSSASNPQAYADAVLNALRLSRTAFSLSGTPAFQRP